MSRAALLLLAACSGGHAAIDARGGDGVNDDAATIDSVPPDAPPACTANGIPGSCIPVADCYGSRMPVPGLCAGSASIQCCTPRFADGVMCDPNAMLEPNVGLVEEAGDPGCLAGMAHAGTSCIDRFEAELVEGTQPWSPYFDPRGHAVRAVSLRGAVPQGFINETDAAAACIAAGKRICTDVEWLRACRGPTTTTFPYGNTRQPGVCNDARAIHPAVELYGTNASWIFSHLDSPCLNQEANGLALTGSHLGCITAEGVFDMMGNLHEWTADPQGTFRGGFYVDTMLNGPGCLYATTAHAVSYWDYSTGFRCCADYLP